MTLGHVAIIEAVAIIAVLGWAAWFVWHTRRRAAEPEDLFPSAFGEAWREAGKAFGTELVGAMDRVVRSALVEREQRVLDLMLLTGADQATAEAIIDTASEVSSAFVDLPEHFWHEAVTAAAHGKFS